MPPKHILLICWDFPPNYGIGGRRWAKFAKSMVNDGYMLHVIKSEVPAGNIQSSWFKDVDHHNIKTYNLKAHWALDWLNDYTSVFSPLKIRMAQLYLRLFHEGTIYDKTLGVKEEFLFLAKNIITKNSIKNVIVTGAPFNLIYYTAVLKKEMPFLNVIADYRDPWINSVNYGMTTLSAKRARQEEEKQDTVFETLDLITAPNEFLIEQIRDTYKGSKGFVKLEALPHIFDPDDFFTPSQQPVKDQQTLRLVYAGALYTDSDRFLELLADNMVKFKNDNPGLNIMLDIYTHHASQVFAKKHLEADVRFLKPLGDKIFEVIGNYDLLVILLSDHNKDFKTTKFFEFLPYKVPYLYVGPAGFVSESIQSEKLGYVLGNTESLSSIHKALHNSPPLEGFNDIAQHSLDRVTKKITQNFI